MSTPNATAPEGNDAHRRRAVGCMARPATCFPAHRRDARRALARRATMGWDPSSRRPMARFDPAFRRGCANRSQDARGGPEAVLLSPRPTRCACPRGLKRTASVPPRDPGAFLLWPGPATPFSRVGASPATMPRGLYCAALGGRYPAFGGIDPRGAFAPRRVQYIADPRPGFARRFAGGAKGHPKDTGSWPEVAPTGTRPTRFACPRVPSGATSGPDWVRSPSFGGPGRR